MWFPTPDADEIVHFTILLSKRDATRGRRGYPSLLAGRYESLVTARAASGVRRLCPPARGRRTRRRSVRHLFASARPESTLSADSIGLDVAVAHGCRGNPNPTRQGRRRPAARGSEPRTGSRHPGRRRTARSRYHGFAKRWSRRCGAPATSASARRLQDRNPSYACAVDGPPPGGEAPSRRSCFFQPRRRSAASMRASGRWSLRVHWTAGCLPGRGEQPGAMFTTHPRRALRFLAPGFPTGR